MAVCGEVSLVGCCAQAELSGLDLGGLPQSAKEVELRRAQEHTEIRARQRLWAERGACALAAAEDMPDELGHSGRYLFPFVLMPSHAPSEDSLI